MSTRTQSRYLEVAVLPELSRLALHERRAAFALRLRAADERSPVEEPPRRGMRLVLAVDRSSSMKGEKLEQARRAASLLLSMLDDDDEVAIVTFDAGVSVVLAPRKADREGKRAAAIELFSMQAGRGTALHGAAVRALELAREVLHGHAVILTDGFPYTGETDPAVIVSSIVGESGRATLTTIGYGSEIDAPLLASMATVGGGRYCHIDEQGDVLAALASELMTVRAVATSKIVATFRPALGVSLATVPHYVSAHDGGATARLAPAVVGDETIVGLELAWTDALGVGRHPGALITIEVGPAGGVPSEVLEIPVQLVIGEQRGVVDPMVSRALCDTVAGIALHGAALGEEPAGEIVRQLADASGWIRGRAVAVGLDPERELRTMLRALDMARETYERGEEDAPRVQACAEGIAKRYDASIGSERSMLDADIRTRSQNIGTLRALELRALELRARGPRE